VRTGFILTRDDLATIAQGCDLGRRVGERRYVLENLFAQDGRPVLGALAAFARAAGGQDLVAMPPVTAQWWRERAGATGALLEELANE
jgi:hypothetical protein